MKKAIAGKMSVARLSGCALQTCLVAALVVTMASIVPGQQTSTTEQKPLPNPVPSPATQTTQPAASPTSTEQKPLPNPAPTTNQTPPTPASQSSNASSASQASSANQANQTSAPIPLNEALNLANAQVSGLRQAQLSERIAVEDVRQARAAFLPRITAPLAYIYTTPALGLAAGEPRVQSFIAPNAISEYQAIINVAGDVDTAGRLRSTLARNQALLAAARAGTEVARRTLQQATIEAYYALALISAQRRAAEQNLAAAEEFERTTALLLSGGEVAPVDVTRATLQTATRRDELERARASESVAADALRVFFGYSFDKPVSTTDLATLLPVDGEVERFTSDAISRRPEFAQFAAEQRAAEQDIRLARSELRPQLSYSISGGFDTDSLRFPRIKEHTGMSAGFNLSIPILDFGASRSRERQAQLRLELAESQRTQAARSFAQQFYSARTQALSAATRIRLTAASITQAQSNLTASIARYRAGEAPIIEVTDAQTTLVTQRLAFYQAIYDYQVALARLRQAAGQ